MVVTRIIHVSIHRKLHKQQLVKAVGMYEELTNDKMHESVVGTAYFTPNPFTVIRGRQWSNHADRRHTKICKKQ